MTASRYQNQRPVATANTGSTAVSGYGDDLIVSTGPAGRIIIYQWLTGRRRIFVICLWLVLEVEFTVNYIGAVGWHRFSILYYPAFTIITLFMAYCTALGVFNKTTTTITAKTFSVRRGPVPCPWPGNHFHRLADVQQIAYAGQHTVIINGNVLYYVYAIFKTGEQSGLFTIGNDESLALELAAQVQDWINEAQRDSKIHISDFDRPEIFKSAGFPPNRAQRLKIIAAVLTLLCALATLIATTEYIAAKYRPAYDPPAEAYFRVQQYARMRAEQSGVR
jgi:hypothetical protein